MKGEIRVRAANDDEPAASTQPYEDTVGLATLYLDQLYGRFSIAFDPREPVDTVRYLRRLAAEASKLADEIEGKVAEAVLQS